MTLQNLFLRWMIGLNAGATLLAVTTNEAPSQPVQLADTTDMSIGSAMVGDKQAFSGAMARTQRSKNSETLSDKDGGVVGDGIADDTTKLQNLITQNLTKTIHVIGTPKITHSINLNGFTGTLIFNRGAKILAGADNITIFLVSLNAYGACIVDSYIDGNGHVGVAAFDLVNFRAYSSGIIRPSILNCANGIIFRSLCWGTKVESPYIFNTKTPIVIMDGSNAIHITNPRIDIFGTVGIDIQSGAPNLVTGIKIDAGYIQHGEIGVRDAAFNSQIDGTYFEACSTADVSLVHGSRYFYAAATSHTASGLVGFKARNADSARIIHPFMASGGRSIGLFDFDATNTNCHADFELGAQSLNLPVGVMTGLGMISKESSGTFTPVAVGSSTAGVGTYTIQTGRWRKIGKRVFVDIDLVWKAHTGTGNTIITGIPVAIQQDPVFNNLFQSAIISSTPWNGPQIGCQFNGNGTELTVLQLSTSGVINPYLFPREARFVAHFSYDSH
jgi:hypothetical protein